jgi:hypothetical protein
MKRKDIEAALAKDPTTVFWVSDYGSRSIPVLVVGFKERATHGRNSWNTYDTATTPATALTRQVSVGDPRAYFGTSAWRDEPAEPATDEYLDERRERGYEINEDEGYWLTPAPRATEYRAGVQFGKITAVAAGSLAEFIVQRKADNARDAEIRAARALAENEAMVAANWVLTRLVNLGFTKPGTTVVSDREKVVVTLTTEAAEALAEVLRQQDLANLGLK